MDSLDHDLLTGETLDVGDKVTRRLSQEQATLPHPAAKSSGPIQSKQEIAAEAVKKNELRPISYVQEMGGSSHAGGFFGD